MGPSIFSLPIMEGSIDRLHQRFPRFPRQTVQEIFLFHEDAVRERTFDTLCDLSSLIQFFPEQPPLQVKNVLLSCGWNVSAAFTRLFQPVFRRCTCIKEIFPLEDWQVEDILVSTSVSLFNDMQNSDSLSDETCNQHWPTEVPQPGTADYYLEVDRCGFHTAIIVRIHQTRVVRRYSYGEKSKHQLTVSEPRDGLLPQRLVPVGTGKWDTERHILQRMEKGKEYNLFNHNCRTFAFFFLVAAGFTYKDVRKIFFDYGLSCGLGGSCLSFSDIGSFICAKGKK